MKIGLKVEGSFLFSVLIDYIIEDIIIRNVGSTAECVSDVRFMKEL